MGETRGSGGGLVWDGVGRGGRCLGRWEERGLALENFRGSRGG